MKSDGERYVELMGYWLNTCNGDLRLVVEQEMSEIEARHPVLIRLNKI